MIKHKICDLDHILYRMNNQKGVAHLLVPVFLLLVAAVAFGLLYFGVIKNPFKNIPFINKIGQQQPTADVKTDYQNPFNKETQYVNPFETYKNPFVIAK